MLGVRRMAAWCVLLALAAGGGAACAPKRIAPVTMVPVPAASPAAPSAAGPGGPTGAQPAGDAAPGAGPDGAGGEGLADAGLDSLLVYGPLPEDAYPGAVYGPPAPGDMPPDAALLPADAQAGERVAALVRTQVGKPYSWGSTGPERFDCSGLAMYVYRQLGIALPRVSLEQASTGVHIERSDLKPGDLVFFSLRRAFDHVGIFLGNNRFVHAPRRHEPVRVDNLDDAWWNRAYRGARRVLGGQP